MTMSNVVRQYALLCVPTTCLMHLVLASLLGLLLLLPVFDLLDAAAATDVGNAADGHGSVTTSCPARCTCRPVTESSPCDWCSSTILPSAGASDAGTHASTSSSSSRLSAADNVSCEGCGAAAADGTSADLLDGDARRGLSASSRQEPLPSTDRPEITVSCADAGLTAVPFELPAATSTLDLAGNQLRQLDPGSLEFAPTEIDSDRDVLAAASTSLSSDFDGPRLINLRLRNNKIDRIASGSFRSPSAASIRVLDLADNRLTALDHGAFNGPMAESLEQLDLSGNAIGGDLGDGPFSALRRLVKLDLRDNLITELSPGSFRGLTSLRQLVLAGNSIKSIDRRTFKPLEKLVYIVLKGNPIGEQPIRFQFHSQSLTYVDLSECQLTDVPKGLPGSARYVQLRRNNITSISKLAFVESPYINILVLDDNRIAEVEDGAFERLTRLQQLWMGGNRLSKVPSGLPATVRRLLLDFNHVENLTDVFPRGSQMTALSLTGNFIRFLAHDAFVKLTVLRTLDLANNQLRQIEPDTFIVQSGLRALQLSGNPLEVLPSRCFSGLASLNILGLAYIPTDDVRIDADVLADAGKSLVRLDIDGSPAVARILLGDEAATNRGSRHLLDAISGVRELNVRSSDLTRLRPQHLPLSLRRQLDGSTATAATQSAAVLRISSSRWHCDADLIWLRDRLLQLTADVADSSVSSSRLQADSEKAAKEAEDENRCATPRQVAGRLLTSLSDSEFEPVVSFHRTSTTATLVLSRSTASGIQIARTPTTGDEALTALNALTTTTDRTHLRDAGDGDKSVGQGISENELTTKYGVQRAGHGTRTQLSAVTAETALDGSRVAAAATIEHENRRRFIERDRWHKWIIDDYDTDDEPETVDIGHNVKDFAVQNNDRGNMTAGVGSRLNGVVRPLHQSLPVTLSNGDINLPLSDDQPLSGTRRSTHGRAVGSLPARTGDVIGERRSLAVHSGDTGSRTTATTTTLYAAAATVGVTVVVAVVIIAVIIRLVRDKKNPPPQALPLTQHPAPDKQPPNPDNAGGCSVAAEDVIEYRHPNGMLYFALQPTVAHSSPLPSRCLHTPRDVTSIDDCLPSTLSSIGAASGDLSLPPSAAAGHDVMMMLSKSAEPLRIYKWEDF